MIRARAFLCALPMLLAACAASAQAPTRSNEVASSDEYREVSAPDDTFGVPLGVAHALTGGYSADAEVRPVIQVRVEAHPDSDGRAIVVASASPLLDDSVKAEEWVAVIVPEGNRWRIETLGVRNKCWRVPDPDQWTADLCP